MVILLGAGRAEKTFEKTGECLSQELMKKMRDMKIAAEVNGKYRFKSESEFCKL